MGKIKDYAKAGAIGLGITAGVLAPNYEKNLAQIASLLNPAGCSMAAHSGTLDVLILNEPATNYINRQSPRVLNSTSRPARRLDFLQHFSRGIEGLTAGIDYEPVSDETQVVPIANGVVMGRYNFKLSGNTLYVYHGLGFVSLYAHLEEMYANVGDAVNRNTVIGLMGNTGEGAVGVTHLHLSLYGPFYTENLKLDNVQQMRNNDTEIFPYAIDPEELSILGRHKPLPYTLPDDSRMDADFNLRIKNARKSVNEYLKLFPHLNRSRFSARVNRYIDYFINKYGGLVDFALDRDIADLYREVSKENPQIPKEDALKIKKSLEEIMANTIIRVTAPIKEPSH